MKTTGVTTVTMDQCPSEHKQQAAYRVQMILEIRKSYFTFDSCEVC